MHLYAFVKTQPLCWSRGPVFTYILLQVGCRVCTVPHCSLFCNKRTLALRI